MQHVCACREFLFFFSKTVPDPGRRGVRLCWREDSYLVKRVGSGEKKKQDTGGQWNAAQHQGGVEPFSNR